MALVNILNRGIGGAYKLLTLPSYGELVSFRVTWPRLGFSCYLVGVFLLNLLVFHSR